MELLFIFKISSGIILLLLAGCGHCKKAKPHFTEAAAKFADNPKVALRTFKLSIFIELRHHFTNILLYSLRHCLEQ